MIEVIEIIGTFFFCLSGALAGRQKKFDYWGCFVLALITGVGGGTLRSVLIGDVPVFFLKNPSSIVIAALSVLMAYLLPRLWVSIKREVSVIDAIGLGVFAASGTQVATDAGLPWWAALGMGAVSATFGGVLRDIIRNEIPLIFRKEIYATAALLGGGLLLLLQHFGTPVEAAIPISAVFTAIIRMLAIRYTINNSSS